jgi:tRNA threonylcarbamoyladenosine biosynthesis protein TsaE
MNALNHALIVKKIAWPNETATQSFAQALGGQPAVFDALLELRGDLGAGKTTFVRHLLVAMGVKGRIKSPTYAVVEPYTLDNGSSIWHFDFYRFNDPREWEEAGFRDIFASPGLKLVEWPDKAGDYLPRADLVVAIDLLDNELRQITLTAQSAIGRALIA